MNIYLSMLAIAGLFFCSTCTQKEAVETLAAEVPVKIWAPEDVRNLPELDVKRGVISKTSEATPGYILTHSTSGTPTYLMNLDGQIVHEWDGDFATLHTYLQDDGRVFRLERDPDFPVFEGGGQTGIIREYTWEGELLWDYKYATEEHLFHHDIELLPNGNILAIAWEVKTKEESIAAGRDPEQTPEAGLWPDKIIEIEPIRPKGGKIVWEWQLWDHLVQEFDPDQDNYGNISDHPRRFNINAHAHVQHMTEEQVQGIKDIGFATSNATVENRGSDFIHANAVSYNAKLDQIVISAPHVHEIWIIDHSTTTEEAKGSTGGRWGHGGDFLYRWGSVASYGRGDLQDQQLFGQHDIKWITDGYPGAGNLLVFNNDIFNPGSKFPHAFAAIGATNGVEFSVADLGNYSAVYELAPPMDENGAYILPEGGTFGPLEPVWSYTAPDKLSFYSPFVSGAQRMKNGNTLVTEGDNGRYFEVTPEGKIVWEYRNPYNQQYEIPDGGPPQPAGPFYYFQFRATHIPLDHPALAGKTLTPIDPQPEVFVPKPPPPQEN